jgi:hypothetical protein
LLLLRPWFEFGGKFMQSRPKKHLQGAIEIIRLI